MLKDFKFKAVYRTEDDNLLEDFYIPALSRSRSYDRGVGYFSSAMLSYAAQGLTTFIKNDGIMRLIIGGEVTAEEADAIQTGYDQRELLEKLGERFLKIIDAVDDNLFQHRINALSWMIAAGNLDIKVALRKQGMYHEKMGVLTDELGDAIVFQGSANETVNALRPDLNFESITVFRDWEGAHHEFVIPYKSGFEKLWAGEARNTWVVDFPDAVKERLISYAKKSRSPPRPDVEVQLARFGEKNDDEDHENTNLVPQLPEFIGGVKYKLHDHQKTAIMGWINNGYHGIFALATGAGKTITAIHAAVRVYEAEKKRSTPLCIIIAAPYINLADQWRTNLNLFNISSIPCYKGKDRWIQRASEAVAAINAGSRDYLCLVVVNATLASDNFQSILKLIPSAQLLWIGDECHHHGSSSRHLSLPNDAKYRIGLSATPEHYIDEDANTRLEQFYGNVVASYKLSDAVRDGVLSPYRYHVLTVELTEEEAAEYKTLTKEIASLFAAKSAQGTLPKNRESVLTNLLLTRARVLGSAQNKIPALRSIISSREIEPHTLFYCGDGSMQDEGSDELYKRQIEVISQELHDLGWKTSRFTSAESSRVRDDILESFRVGAIDAMVAIRCLDEGIDIPACKTAFLLASARNPRQFVQRRGRILRRAPNKEFSEVFDFFVKLPEPEDESEYEAEKRLVESELVRVAEFANMSLNPTDSYEALEELLCKYDLEHLLVDKTEFIADDNLNQISEMEGVREFDRSLNSSEVEDFMPEHVEPSNEELVKIDESLNLNEESNPFSANSEETPVLNGIEIEKGQSEDKVAGDSKGQSYTISQEKIRERLIEFRETVIMAEFPNSNPSNGILRDGMIAALLDKEPTSEDEFRADISRDFLKETDLEQIKFAKEITDIIYDVISTY
jgi:superfamily II DNA or RNA helicase